MSILLLKGKLCIQELLKLDHWLWRKRELLPAVAIHSGFTPSWFAASIRIFWVFVCQRRGAASILLVKSSLWSQKSTHLARRLARYINLSDRTQLHQKALHNHCQGSVISSLPDHSLPPRLLRFSSTHQELSVEPKINPFGRSVGEIHHFEYGQFLPPLFFFVAAKH